MAGLKSKDAAKKDVKNLPSDWLSLKISQKPAPYIHSAKASVFISVPKKIVALSTRRHRLKRLIREAVRGDNYFKDEKRTYFFRVNHAPDTKILALKDVLGTVERLKKEI